MTRETTMTREDDPIALFALTLGVSDSPWLRQALTHSSYVNEHPELPHGHNERLEFLGDAVLSLCVSHLLMELLPDASEGKLSKLRSSLVNEASLAQAARRLGVGEVLLLGRGEEHSGGRQKSSLLADAYEAILAAIYLQEGFSTALAFLRFQLKEAFEEILRGGRRRDHKTRLQEILQRQLGVAPQYEVVSTQGPDHAKVFSVLLKVGGEPLAEGEGRSKKEAEQKAAENALCAIEALAESWPLEAPSAAPAAAPENKEEESSEAEQES